MTAGWLGVWIAAGLVALGSCTALAAGDPAKGEKVYRKCKACHAADEEKISWGPHLVGIVGRPAASVEGFRGYSQAMKDLGIVWDEATLDKYLTDPRAMMPKTNMPFPGVNNEDDRRDVIAYLKTLQR